MFDRLLEATRDSRDGRNMLYNSRAAVSKEAKRAFLINARAYFLNAAEYITVELKEMEE